MFTKLNVSHTKSKENKHLPPKKSVRNKKKNNNNKNKMDCSKTGQSIHIKESTKGTKKEQNNQ